MIALLKVSAATSDQTINDPLSAVKVYKAGILYFFKEEKKQRKKSLMFPSSLNSILRLIDQKHNKLKIYLNRFY